MVLAFLTMFRKCALSNDLPQPQPPGSQAPMKVWSSESPADAEKKRDGGC
jgi:hypothetical protein